MTITALTRFISKRRKGEIWQVERGPDGHATVYFSTRERATGKVRHFTIICNKAEKIRVYPESFSKLAIRADTDSSRRTGKRRKVIFFDEMFITGYGFESIYVPVG
jgi:hypothetical protein